MPHPYVIADVFTDRPFQGNPLAVVLDADGLAGEQMQAIAREFAYSETAFVLRPHVGCHTARVRIFTPAREVPFAGHPTIGTAFVLAHRLAARGAAMPDRLVLEQEAGPVAVTLARDGNAVIGAELRAPRVLSCHAQVLPAHAAACLSLTVAELRLDAHAPQVVSVGLPVLAVELASWDALRRAKPDGAACARLLPLDGANAIYAYTRDIGVEADCDLRARMFTARLTEDAATGSAVASVAALLAELRGVSVLNLRVRQGVEMGRPGLLLARVERQDGGTVAFVGGRCVCMMEGRLLLGHPKAQPLARTSRLCAEPINVVWL